MRGLPAFLPTALVGLAPWTDAALGVPVPGVDAGAPPFAAGPFPCSLLMRRRCRARGPSFRLYECGSASASDARLTVGDGYERGVVGYSCHEDDEEEGGAAFEGCGDTAVLASPIVCVQTAWLSGPLDAVSCECVSRADWVGLDAHGNVAPITGAFPLAGRYPDTPASAHSPGETRNTFDGPPRPFSSFPPRTPSVYSGAPDDYVVPEWE
jgi:hypothetical protein